VTRDLGAPISYLVLAEGTRVESADGQVVGKVRRVLADPGADLFDGIVIDTDGGDRFADSPEVDELYEQVVILRLTAEEARRLPEHSPAPAVIDASSEDIAEDTTGDRMKDAAKRAWDRLSGNY
jgi:hypothetical protein